MQTAHTKTKQQRVNNLFISYYVLYVKQVAP